MTPGLAVFKLAFQLSPIVLTGGIAQDIPGGMLPLIAVTEAVNFVDGLLSGAQNIEMDDFFAHFEPMPGSTLVDQQVGTYPFANQAVAGNAVIQQPLTLSMMMKCPVRDTLGYAAKLVIMTALIQVINQHNARGGTYTVITPSQFYTNGLLTAIRDASSGESHQTQNAYQWDFYFPLLTLQQAQQVQNSLMSRLSGGTQVNAGESWSGAAPAVGTPNSLLASSIIPSSGGAAVTTSPFAGGLT
jgi:hypothetical protein